jgi:hypothetical protein
MFHSALRNLHDRRKDTSSTLGKKVEDIIQSLEIEDSESTKRYEAEELRRKIKQCTTPEMIRQKRRYKLELRRLLERNPKKKLFKDGVPYEYTYATFLYDSFPYIWFLRNDSFWKRYHSGLLKIYKSFYEKQSRSTKRSLGRMVKQLEDAVSERLPNTHLKKAQKMHGMDHISFSTFTTSPNLKSDIEIRGLVSAIYEEHFEASIPKDIQLSHQCKWCGHPINEIDNVGGFILCSNCHRRWISYDLHSSRYDDTKDVDVQTFVYDPRNHIREVMLQIEGSKSANMDDDSVIDLIHECYMRERCKEFTIQKTREFLKQSRFSIYYDDAHYITNRLLKRENPDHSLLCWKVSQINQTLSLYDMVYPVFLKYKDLVFREKNAVRTSFLGTRYFIRQACLIYKWTEWLPHIPIMRGVINLQKHNTIWKMITDELNLPFIEVDRALDIRYKDLGV